MTLRPLAGSIDVVRARRHLTMSYVSSDCKLTQAAIEN